MSKRDFITLLDCSAEELSHIITRSRAWRQRFERNRNPSTSNAPYEPLHGRTAGLVLEANSTRTRVGFEAGLHHMGGHVVVLKSGDTQLGRGEPVRDMARVLSEMLDIIIIRTLQHDVVEELAEWATVPVVNAMTNRFHPCQLLADVQTFEELRGPIQGKTVAFIGDGYNMCHSYINAARQWGFNLRIACPEGFEPDPDILSSANNLVQVCDSAAAAVDRVDLVVTDVWSSMGHEAEQDQRNAKFKDYQVNEQLLEASKPDSLFMHCLPAHRGEEVSETLLDDSRSVVWHEAGNRLHSQKALMEFLLLGEQHAEL
jgi:ornithine carbamoyltransferase